MGFVLAALMAISAYIYPTLQEKLQSAGPDDQIAVLVHLSDKPDFEGKRGMPHSEYVNYLKTFAENSQRTILAELNSKYSGKISDLKTYWIFNGFYMKATKDVIYYLAGRNDVEYIIDDQIIRLSMVTPSKEEIPAEKTVEWNVLMVKADSCWLAGYDGTGIVIAHMDTGVDPNHPALSGKWLGSPYWYDAVAGQSSPYDDQGHGTHTMGTILGGDGLGPFTDDIGVAPGAKYVSCKIFDYQGYTYLSWIHNGFQAIADWKAQGVNIVASSNSWGSTEVTNTEFWQDVINWRNLDIVPVFAAGNNGPNAGTINTPGSFPTAIAVGATNSSNNVASFSCRGPAPNQNPWNNTSYWPRSDWNFIKPNISAPGVSVRSALPGGSYASWDGTSMATPHVAGAIAILKQRNPNLTFEQIYNLLLDHAQQPSQGAPYPNNNYGWGILDIYQALLATPSPSEPAITYTGRTFTDENSNEIWDPGETIYIVVSLRNNGTDASNVNVALSTSTSGISVLDGNTSFNTISSNQEVNNSSDPFVVSASSSVSEGVAISFSLNITCDGGYEWNYNFDIPIGVPGSDLVNHSPGNIVLTVTRYGTLGYMSSSQSQGSGCRYPSSSASHLFYGAFAVGNDPTYVIDRYYESNNVDDDDWVTLTDPDGRTRIYSPYNSYHEFSKAAYSDAGGETTRGLTVYQRGYTFNDDNGPNYVILEYVLYNASNTPISNLYAGLFTDWDIGSASSNAGGTDTTRNMAYLYYSTTYMGTAVLNPLREQGLIANRSVIDHDVYVYPNSGLPDNIMWNFLNGTNSQANTNRSYDWSTVVSTGPFTIAPYDSVKVSFAVAGADNLTNLQAYFDDAYVRYWGIIMSEGETQRVIKFSINEIVKGNVLKLTVPEKGKITISAYDVRGSMVFTTTIENKTYDFNIRMPDLPAGLYFVKVDTRKGSYTGKIIVVK